MGWMLPVNMFNLDHDQSWKILGMLKFWCRNSALDGQACQQSLKNFNATFRPSRASSGIQYREKICCIKVFEWPLTCLTVQIRISTLDHDQPVLDLTFPVCHFLLNSMSWSCATCTIRQTKHDIIGLWFSECTQNSVVDPGTSGWFRESFII